MRISIIANAFVLLFSMAFGYGIHQLHPQTDMINAGYLSFICGWIVWYEGKLRNAGKL